LTFLLCTFGGNIYTFVSVLAAFIWRKSFYRWK